MPVYEQFWGIRLFQETLASALPGDVIQFLIFHAGRTTVHRSESQALASPETGRSCPKRLAHGTVDSLIGKICAILCICEEGQGLGVACPPWGKKSHGLSLR